MSRGDYDVSEAKLKKILDVEDLQLAPPQTIREVTGAEIGYSGVVGLSGEVELIADLTTEGRVNFECGANETDFHLLNVNFDRDIPKPKEFYDVRRVKEGETCTECGEGDLHLVKAVKVASFDPIPPGEHNRRVSYMGKDGNRHTVFLTRLKLFTPNLFALMIQNSWDKDGLIWPKQISPFHVHLISLGEEKEILQKAEELYHNLGDNNIQVLWDDRDKKAGVKFNDSDLLGFPIRLVISKKSYQQDSVEFKQRDQEEAYMVCEDEIVDKVKGFYKGYISRLF